LTGISTTDVATTEPVRTVLGSGAPVGCSLVERVFKKALRAAAEWSAAAGLPLGFAPSVVSLALLHMATPVRLDTKIVRRSRRTSDRPTFNPSGCKSKSRSFSKA